MTASVITAEYINREYPSLVQAMEHDGVSMEDVLFIANANPTGESYGKGLSTKAALMIQEKWFPDQDIKKLFF